MIQLLSQSPASPAASIWGNQTWVVWHPQGSIRDTRWRSLLADNGFSFFLQTLKEENYVNLHFVKFPTAWFALLFVSPLPLLVCVTHPGWLFVSSARAAWTQWTMQIIRMRLHEKTWEREKKLCWCCKEWGELWNKSVSLSVWVCVFVSNVSCCPTKKKTTQFTFSNLIRLVGRLVNNLSIIN